MAQVEVTINGRSYQVACDDGEENHLLNLADYLNRKVGELVTSVGQVGETRLMLMAGLVIADELAATIDKLEAAEGEIERVAKAKGATEAEVDSARGALDRVARRIEAIVANVERT
jgi:cell division protein ZapA